MIVNLIVFDAQMDTYTKQREYHTFLRDIKSLGYSILQNSFYYRQFDNHEKATNSIVSIENITPKSIEVSIITLSEMKYNKIISLNYTLPPINHDTIISI